MPYQTVNFYFFEGFMRFPFIGIPSHNIYIFYIQCSVWGSAEVFVVYIYNPRVLNKYITLSHICYLLKEVYFGVLKIPFEKSLRYNYRILFVLFKYTCFKSVS